MQDDKNLKPLAKTAQRPISEEEMERLIGETLARHRATLERLSKR